MRNIVLWNIVVARIDDTYSSVARNSATSQRRVPSTYVEPSGLYRQEKRKKEGKIVLDGSTMQCEKRTITSFVKYRRRENWQYLQAAIIIEEKGKKKEKSC